MIISEKFKLKKLLILLPIMLFTAVYAAIPARVTIKQGQKPILFHGITAEASTQSVGSYNCRVKLFNIIPIKTVSVSVTPQMYVIPSGETIGVKIYTQGVLVVGIADVRSEDGKILQPAKNAGIMVGDRIVALDGQAVSTAESFCQKINGGDGSVTASVIRGSKKMELPLSAVYSTESHSFRVGLWVRDSTAGIGTLTFYNPENSTFAALGHAICDNDTKDVLTVRRGAVNLCTIKDVYKGEKGSPGELIGDFKNTELGNITKNCHQGIYGRADTIPQNTKLPVASRFQVKEGKASILCDVDGSGPMPYEIEITKISKMSQETNKSFVIKVTDKTLLEKTGGIVQGMSGSPIIQDGMLAGAVTHVFVNDPTKGYGIFAENMLDMTMNLE